jgi:DNA adenine methylase
VTSLTPLLKWPGGKRGELTRILPLIPTDIERYIEPFVGGGAVWFSQPVYLPAAVNDTCVDLVDLYRRVAGRDPDLLGHLTGLADWWHDLTDLAVRVSAPVAPVFVADPDGAPDDLAVVAARAVDGCGGRSAPAGYGPAFARELAAGVPAKVARMRRAEWRRGARLPLADVHANLEAAVRAAAYTAVRWRYNADRAAGTRSAEHTARFLVLRELAYAAMFRFNADGGFNVPYGGITYNRRDLRGKVAYLTSNEVQERLATTTFACTDFAAFVSSVDVGPDDYLFCDPPYDSDFSAYDGGSFTLADHERLAALLKALPCRFQLVVKRTEATDRIYRHGGWRRLAFDKTYLWTIKERNDRRATHLVIANHDLPVAV